MTILGFDLPTSLTRRGSGLRLLRVDGKKVFLDHMIE